jgi:hypothetical protein
VARFPCGPMSGTCLFPFHGDSTYVLIMFAICISKNPGVRSSF